MSRRSDRGGVGGSGTNPEQLFGAGYSGCFLSALHFVAAKQKLALSAGTAVTGQVAIGPLPTGFGLQVELTIAAPGLAREQFQSLVDQAHVVALTPTPRVEKPKSH